MRSSACCRALRRCVRTLVCSTAFPLASSLPSTASAVCVGSRRLTLFGRFVGPMELSASLPPCITIVLLGGFSVRTWLRWARSDVWPPGSRTQCFRACQGSATPPGQPIPRHTGIVRVAFRVFGARRHPAQAPLAGLHTLPARSPVNASRTPLPRPAHDSGPAWVARPSLSGTCTLQHCAGLSRHTRTLALTCCRKRERRTSGRWRQSGAAPAFGCAGTNRHNVEGCKSPTAKGEPPTLAPSHALAPVTVPVKR